MCLAMYASVAQLMPGVSTADFSAQPVATDHAVRGQLEQSSVYALDAGEGCSCGFATTDDSPEVIARTRSSLRQLVQFLDQARSHGPVRLFACWSGEEWRRGQQVALTREEAGSATHWSNVRDGALKNKVYAFDFEPTGDVSTIRRAGERLQKLGDDAGAAATFHREAIQFLRDGFPLKAIALLKHVFRLDPTRLDARELLARTYVEMGLFAEGQAEYESLMNQLGWLARDSDRERISLAIAQLASLKG